MDIVERLRDEASMYDADDVDLHLDAVNEIERLRETIETLKEEIYLLNRNQPSGDKPDEDS